MATKANRSPWADLILNQPKNEFMTEVSPKEIAMVMDTAKPPQAPPKPAMAMPDLSNLKVQSMSFSGSANSDPQIEGEIKNDIQERRGGIKGMQEQIEALKNKQYGAKDLNLQPLVALTDSWMGTNVSSKYEPPNTMQKDKETIAKLEESINKQRGEVTDDMINLLKQKSDQSQMKLALDSFRQKRFDESLALKKEDNLRKDVNKLADEYQTVQGQLNMAEDAIRSGDTRSVQMVVSSIARNIGEQKGSLSDSDVQRSMPPDVATSVAQLEAYLGQNSKISPELQGAFMNLIGTARNKSNLLYNESINRRKAQYSSGVYSPLMQEGRVGDVIFNEATRPVSAPTTQGSTGFLSPEDWLKNKRSQK